MYFPATKYKPLLVVFVHVCIKQSVSTTLRNLKFLNSSVKHVDVALNFKTKPVIEHLNVYIVYIVS